MPKSSIANLRPEVADAAHDVERALRLAQRQALGDLELESVGREAGLLQHHRDAPDDAVVGEVAARQVRGHPQRRQPVGVPLHGLRARVAHHPRVDLDDEVGLLGERHEVRRGQQTERRVLPPDERLDAHDVTGAEIDLRLVQHAQLVAPECVVQLAAPREVHLRLLVRARVVEARAVAARVLRAVHRSVGVAQQLARVRAVVREHGDADARGHEELVPVDHERPAHRAEQLLGHDAERFAVADAGQQDREVVGAHARDRVAFAHRAGQASADALQELVAHRVAEARVDLLEAVEVDHEHGELLPERASPLHGLVHAVFEEQLVGEAREAVVRGLMADLADEVGVLEGRRADGADRLEQLDVGGVEAGHALAPTDDEPLLVVVADGKAHAALLFGGRRRADPRVPSVQKLLGRVREGAGDVVRVDRGVDLLRGAQEAVESFAVESGAQVLAEHDVDHDERHEREKQRPRIGRRAQAGEHADRHRAHPLQHARPEPVAQVRRGTERPR